MMASVAQCSDDCNEDHAALHASQVLRFFPLRSGSTSSHAALQLCEDLQRIACNNFLNNNGGGCHCRTQLLAALMGSKDCLQRISLAPRPQAVSLEGKLRNSGLILASSPATSAFGSCVLATRMKPGNIVEHAATVLHVSWQRCAQRGAHSHCLQVHRNRPAPGRACGLMRGTIASICKSGLKVVQITRRAVLALARAAQAWVAKQTSGLSKDSKSHR